MEISEKILVNIRDNELEIKLFEVKSKIGGLILIGIFALVGVLVPIIVFILSIINDFDLGFGFFISILMGLGMSVYLTRIFLWNKYGVEIFNIEANKITYTTDYKYFKEKVEDISGDKLFIDKCCLRKLTRNNVEIEIGKLYLKIDGKEIISNIELPIDDLDLLLEKVKAAKIFR